MKVEEVLELKKEIDECKTEKAQLEGEQKAIMKQLEEDWSCTSIKQAEKKVTAMKEEIERLKEEIESRLEEIEKEL